MYRAPIEEIAFTLKHVAGLQAALEAGQFGDLDEEVADAILAEAGRFASDEIAPLQAAGDEVGAVLSGSDVTMPPGWRDLYKHWTAAGWNALSAPERFGGQGLPVALGVAALEMWNSGSMAFAIGPTLTMGAVEAIDRHASEQVRQAYLAKLVSGEWTATMNLTEPQAGSDLSAVRSRAEPAGDGTYRIFGQKIFITYGEHDLTDNIVHMVLARLPEAPPGTRGLSLFLVPKYLPGQEGRLGKRNDVFCAGLEHKLGLHASPTCTMIYGDGRAEQKGAVGWLIGEENRGLACMFTMMNNARLAVGMQGVGVAEAAFQKALAYASERRQGRASGHRGNDMAPIVYHPDVQRMLLTMLAMTRAARAISYCCAHAIDMARISKGEEQRHWQERANLLTPVAKAFCTDVGVEVTSLGIQVHGGMGFIEETGAARLYRDARIAPIYEGTNGIQAIDLLTRKLPQADGDHVHGYIAELGDVVASLADAGGEGLERGADALKSALGALSEATTHLQKLLAGNRAQDALGGATPYLRLFAIAAGGAYLAKAALADRSDSRVAALRFFAENLSCEAMALKDIVLRGSDSLTAAAAHLLRS
jgi:alkylation response protein AidB-like acyl-CoA dehydrogenase